MPNFRGKRLTNAHETLIWASRDEASKYTFNYEALKALNDGVQMRSDWVIPLCTGHERLKDENGDKAHPTQKPEALLHRILVATTNPGDVVLDPFFGTGTTGAVAKMLGRDFIGIEREEAYRKVAARPASTASARFDRLGAGNHRLEARRTARALRSGRRTRHAAARARCCSRSATATTAKVRADGTLIGNDVKGSIHQVGAALEGAPVLQRLDLLALQARRQDGPDRHPAPADPRRDGG